MDVQKDKGGRIAASFRSANIAEGLAIQMLRPFAATAPVPREEDYGIDLIGTLIRKSGKAYAAEDSFAVQIKTHTSANFHFSGEGLKWLRELDLPYFPVIVNLGSATLSLFTLNQHRRAYLRNSRISEITLTIDGDGTHDFPLGDPLLTWTLEEATHPEFPTWAYSILKPAIKIESWNQRYAAAQSIRTLEYETQLFTNRQSDGSARKAPRGGTTLHTPPGDGEFIQDAIISIMDPFTGWISNTGKHDFLGIELLNLRSAFRRLGLDPDPTESWDRIVTEMNEYATQQEPST